MRCVTVGARGPLTSGAEVASRPQSYLSAGVRCFKLPGGGGLSVGREVAVPRSAEGFALTHPLSCAHQSAASSDNFITKTDFSCQARRATVPRG